MPLEPKPGLVVRYDFLWRENRDAGIDSGKDRPCAIVLVSAERADGSRDVLLCAITHSPPDKNQTAVPMPPAVAKHLGLDSEPAWIKTDQVNRLRWEKDRIPHGITPVRKGQWVYGSIPQALGQQVFDQLRQKARMGAVTQIGRDTDNPD